MITWWFWLVATGCCALTLAITFPQATLQFISKLKRYLHDHCAQRYGQRAADNRIPLHPWEVNPWEKRGDSDELTLEQFYALLWPSFFKYWLNLSKPPRLLETSRRSYFKLTVLGFLLSRGLVRLHLSQPLIINIGSGKPSLGKQRKEGQVLLPLLPRLWRPWFEHVPNKSPDKLVQ